MNESTLTEVFNTLNIDRDQDTAKAYGLTYLDNELVAKFIDDDGDIYSLIENINDDKILPNTNFNFFTMITHGWAAPLNNDGEVDGAPKSHPDRRRVRLVIAVDMKNGNDIASIMQFEDDPDNLIFDHGNATGSLAEAISSLFV